MKLGRLRRFEADVKKGKLSLHELAVKYKTRTSRIQKHMSKCHKAEDTSGYQTLSELLEQVKTDLETARDNALFGDEDSAKGATFFYTSLIREARELVAAIEKLQPHEAIGKELKEIAVQPLVTEMARILIEEGMALTTELQTLLGSSFDQGINRAIKDAWKRMSSRIRNEYKFVDGRLASVLSKDRSKAEPKKLIGSSKKPAPDNQLH